jgi:segregation and condensation protein B
VAWPGASRLFDYTHMELDYPAIIECLLFVSGEPVPAERLAEVLDLQEDAIPGLIDQLNAQLEGRGLQVTGLAGGYCLTTRLEHADWVERFLQPDPERLSVQALETLAIIAYRQPLTRPEIDSIRGVNSSGMVGSLIERGLVRIAGRKDAPGRPFLLETTPEFLSAFGLKELTQLPSLEAIEGSGGKLPRLSQPISPATPNPLRQVADGVATGDEAEVPSGVEEAVGGTAGAGDAEEQSGPEPEPPSAEPAGDDMAETQPSPEADTQRDEEGDAPSV